MADPFDISFDALPAEMPLFPLPRVILLPRAQLPLNIFEPRYLAMTRAALATDRLIGMIQPQDETGRLCKTGCAGRIVSFSETDDGRYLITLKGVARFNLSSAPVQAAGGYLQVKPEWSAFKGDLEPDTVTDICRETMVNTLHAYFKKMGMSCDQWEQIRQIGCEKLVATLSVVCPFDAEEKQALLEAPKLSDRARILHGLLESAVRESCGSGCNKDTCH
ncbi:MAG TPA: LON peptidase substrate-binding domain-containing protein [Alphaproteobacteria bacterium]|nr:peptidase S16 [Rhodospirillaceae bacterium]HRJ67359.1 LON peptidase substrate-binding domain-containing protein [Alphaproteobacteria bacterium]